MSAGEGVSASPLLAAVPGIAHGFGTRAEPVPRALGAEWEKRAPQWTQVHGRAVAEARAPGADCGDVDGLYTFTPGVPVVVRTADCVPILLARADGRAVAAVHAGWRGTRAKILEALWQALSSRGEKPSDWVASIGPAIGPCCYQVSEEIAGDFVREFSDLGAGKVCPSHRMLDLPAINEFLLRSSGIGKIEVLRRCTRCMLDEAGEPIYHSYRREGAGTRQYSGLIIRA